jgi:hypothetical protein
MLPSPHLAARQHGCSSLVNLERHAGAHQEAAACGGAQVNRHAELHGGGGTVVRDATWLTVGWSVVPHSAHAQPSPQHQQVSKWYPSMVGTGGPNAKRKRGGTESPGGRDGTALAAGGM